MDLWRLERRQQVDPEEVREALRQSADEPLDARTRQLAREFEAALEGRTVADARFPTLALRIRPLTRPAVLEEFLRGLETRLVVGGAAALILQGLLQRSLDHVDVVGECPAVPPGPLRLARLAPEGLPAGWEERLQDHEHYRLLDPLDTFMAKLISRRDEDFADLQHLRPSFPVEQIRARLSTLARHLADPRLRETADHNWYVLLGEPLPRP